MADYENIDLTAGPRINVYGWTKSKNHDKPTVFLGITYHPLSAGTSMTPAEARAVADSLTIAANAADEIDNRRDD